MKPTILQNLLNKNISPELFSQSIKNEIEAYKRLLSKRGSSIPIIVDEDVELSIGLKARTSMCGLDDCNFKSIVNQDVGKYSGEK